MVVDISRHYATHQQTAGQPLPLPAGDRRPPGSSRARRVLLPRRRQLDAGRLPRRRRLLRDQRLPDHLAAAARVPRAGQRAAGPLLAAPGAAAAAGGRRPDRGDDDRRRDPRARPDRRPARRRDRLALLLRQLALHLRRRLLLRTVPGAVAVHPPLVALGRGAVLPLLAAGLRRRDEAVRPRPAAARRPRRRARLGRSRLDPVRPRPRRLARLLRHRHARRRPPARRRPGAGLEPDRAAPPPQRPAGRPDPRPGRRPRPRLRGAQLPPRARLRPGAMARRLSLAGAGHGAAGRRPRPPGGAAGLAARPAAGALARAAQLQLLPLALAGAGADPAGDRRQPAAGNPDPAAAARGTGPRRPLLPLRRASLPRSRQAAGAVPALAGGGAAGAAGRRPRGRRLHRLERPVRDHQPPGRAGHRLDADRRPRRGRTDDAATAGGPGRSGGRSQATARREAARAARARRASGYRRPSTRRGSSPSATR